MSFSKTGSLGKAKDGIKSLPGTEVLAAGGQGHLLKTKFSLLLSKPISLAQGDSPPNLRIAWVYQEQSDQYPWMGALGMVFKEAPQSSPAL